MLRRRGSSPSALSCRAIRTSCTRRQLRSDLCSSMLMMCVTLRQSLYGPSMDALAISERVWERMVTIKVCIYDGASWFCGCGDDRSDDVQRTSTVLFLKWVRGLLIECNCMLTSTTDTVLMSLYKVCVEWQDVCVCVCLPAACIPTMDIVVYRQPRRYASRVSICLLYTSPSPRD